MISDNPRAIQFYVKCAWMRGNPTNEIIKKVYKTFGKNDQVNKAALSCLALLHAGEIYRSEEY